MRSVVAVLVLFAVFFFGGGASVAHAHEETARDGDLEVAIDRARESDPEGFEKKVSLLRSSDALMALFAGAPDEETIATYVDFFALNSTVEQVEAFLERTEGKHLVVKGTVEDFTVEIVDGPAVSTRGSCCACWEAWTASAAYFAGSGLLCAGVSAGGAVISGGVGADSGFVCGGVFLGDREAAEL